MQFLTNIQWKVIITLKQTNKTWQYIIDFMRSKHDVTVSKSGMQKLWRKLRETGMVKDKIRSGRPKK